MQITPEDNVEFIVPEQPAPRVSEGGSSAQASGKREGAGRKRRYEGGYKAVRNTLWKSISFNIDIRIWKLDGGSQQVWF